jgi:hypothetical protein
LFQIATTLLRFGTQDQNERVTFWVEAPVLFADGELLEEEQPAASVSASTAQPTAATRARLGERIAAAASRPPSESFMAPPGD